jgi:divalent metal cation (Fe/Co/Zn/Cd) transporter
MFETVCMLTRVVGPGSTILTWTAGAFTLVEDTTGVLVPGSVAMIADVVNGALDITVTGVAGIIYTWHATIMTSEAGA